VIHEALMLLRDTGTSSNTMERFINAIDGTKILAKPPYIQMA